MDPNCGQGSDSFVVRCWILRTSESRRHLRSFRAPERNTNEIRKELSGLAAGEDREPIRGRSPVLDQGPPKRLPGYCDRAFRVKDRTFVCTLAGLQARPEAARPSHSGVLTTWTFSSIRRPSRQQVGYRNVL